MSKIKSVVVFYLLILINQYLFITLKVYTNPYAYSIKIKMYNLPSLITFLFTLFFCSTSFSQYFNEVAQQKGISDTYGNGAFGGGISFADFNQDGWDDISIATEAGRPPSFYQNQDGYFEQVYFNGLNNIKETKQILWADVDNDGDRDLLLTATNAGNFIHINDGNFNFSSALLPGPPGFEVNSPSFGAAMADVNNDGFLDIFICHHTNSIGLPDQLFLNQGDGTFYSINSLMPWDITYQLSFMPVFFDMDKNLSPDLYVAVDRNKPNQLFKNIEGDFVDVGLEYQADIVIDGMGISVADFDSDTDLDLYISNTQAGNVLLQNSDSLFEQIDFGISYNEVGWGVNFFDFDNDADLDLYVCGANEINPFKNAFYVNLGDNLFEDQIDALGLVEDSTFSFSNAIGDFNNDGAPDIAVHNLSPDSLMLWENTNDTNHWLKVDLVGTVSNRDGVGAWIELYFGTNKQVRYTHCGIAYLGQNSDYELIGISTEDLVDSLIVKWPSGIINKLYQIPTNQKIKVVEGNNTLTDINLINTNFVSQIFPNPTKDFIFVDFMEEGEYNWKLVNQRSQVVQRGNFTGKQLKINTKFVENGIFYLQIFNKTNFSISKVLLIN